MNARRLLTIGLAAILGACAGETATTPTPTATSTAAFSLRVFVYEGTVGGKQGVQSPAGIDLTFKNVLDEPMDIVSATLTLRDDAGFELARQIFGATAGTLTFRPAWEGGGVGRKLDILLEARVSGRTSTAQFTLTL